MKKLLVFFSLVLVACLMAGCSVSAEGITITSKDNVRTIKVNETLQLTAKVFPENADQAVVWSTSAAEIATVSESGLVTGVAKGNVEIIATAKKDGKIKQSFSLIIEAAGESTVNPESITVSAENNVTTCKVGEEIRLTAVVLPAEASQSVVWTSSDQTIATVSRGVVTPLKEGSVTITATAKNDATVYATITLTFEPSDDQVITKDWANMEYTSHANYLTAEKGTPLKVKGVVTHVATGKENTVNYFIQNGTEGYYVYGQNALTFPVELGKVYEVGGLKKYYNGLNEIGDVEYFVELSENITYTVNDLEGLNASDLTAMEPYHCSVVKGTGTLVSVSVHDSKAYNVVANINGFDTTLRVDPAYMNADEFAAINKLFKTAVVGGTFDFVGLMTAFGYGKASPQIQIKDADDLVFAELTTKDILEAAAAAIQISKSIAFSVNDIELPLSLDGFDNLTVSWESNSEVINAETGVVTHAADNTFVTLTATLSLDGEEQKVTFEVLVFALDNTDYEVVASLDLEDASLENSYGCSATKPKYEAGVIELGTPKTKWLLKNALIGGADSDRREGIYSIRAQAGKSAAETARIEVQEDGEYNVVEFAVALYGGDAAGVQIKIEYSTDSGSTWVAAPETIIVDSTDLQTYRIKLPEGVKRVAIVVVENTGKRVSIDNIKLMK